MSKYGLWQKKMHVMCIPSRFQQVIVSLIFIFFAFFLFIYTPPKHLQILLAVVAFLGMRSRPLLLASLLANVLLLMWAAKLSSWQPQVKQVR